LSLRIDGAYYLFHDLCLLPAKGIFRGAVLAVDICSLEGIRISDMKPSNTDPGKGYKMDAANPAKSCNGNSGVF